MSGKCDFDSTRDPPWLEGCNDSTFPLLGDFKGRSEGAWASCEACHWLIAREDTEGLARRALRKMRKNGTVPAHLSDRMMLPHVRRMHEQFWMNRTGISTKAS